MKRTDGFWNAVFEALVKSLYRVPIPITRSASRASDIGTWRAGNANSAQLLRMIKRERTFAGLGLAYRDSRLATQIRERPDWLRNR